MPDFHEHSTARHTLHRLDPEPVARPYIRFDHLEPEPAMLLAQTTDDVMGSIDPVGPRPLAQVGLAWWLLAGAILVAGMLAGEWVLSH